MVAGTSVFGLEVASSPLEEWRAQKRREQVGVMANPSPRILLVDDDPIFCYAFEKFASKFQVNVKSFDSFSEFDEGNPWNYDFVLMDYDLGTVNGVEFAEYIGETIGDVPLLLVSYTQRKDNEARPWPKVIRDFSCKERGIDAVFDGALRVYSRARKGWRSH